MFYGSMAKGFSEGYDKAQRRRREVAQLFEQFRQANPEATVEDFNKFLGAIGGNGYRPVSDDQLQSYAQQGAQVKKRRLRNEALADAQNKSRTYQDFLQVLNPSLLAVDDPTMGLQNALNKYTDNAELRATLSEQYAPQVATLQAQAQNAAIGNVMQTFGDSLAKEDRGNINLDEYFGGEVGNRLSDKFYGVLDGKQKAINEQLYNTAKTEIDKLAMNEGDIDLDGVIDRTLFYGAGASDWTAKLKEHAKMVQTYRGQNRKSKAKDKLKEDLRLALNRDQYRDAYLERGMDQTKTLATDEYATSYDELSRDEVAAVVSTAFDGVQPTWDQFQQDKTTRFVTSTDFDDLESVAREEGWGRDEFKQRLKDYDITPTDYTLDQVMAKVRNTHRREVSDASTKAVQQFTASAKQYADEQETKRDESFSKLMADLFGEGNALGLPQYDFMGEALKGKYSVDPRFVGELRTFLAEELEGSGKDLDELSQNEAREIVELGIEKFASRKPGSVMLDEQRKRIDRQTLKTSSQAWEAETLDEYLDTANGAAEQLLSTLNYTIGELEGKPVEQWTADDLAAIKQVSDQLKTEGAHLVQDTEARVKRPSAWLIDYQEAAQVGELGFDNPKLKPIKLLRDVFAKDDPNKLHKRLASLASKANWWAQWGNKATSTNPDDSYNALSQLSQILTPEEYKRASLGFRKQNQIQYPDKHKIRKMSADDLAAAEELANDPAGSMQSRADAEKLQTQLSGALKEYRELLQEVAQDPGLGDVEEDGKYGYRRQGILNLARGKAGVLEARISRLMAQLNGQ